jgi:hypothetical protein
MTFFKSIGAWFAKVFKKLPAWNVIALSALNVAAPLLEDVLKLADPAAEALVAPVLTRIQGGLGTVSGLLTGGSTKNLASELAAIKAEFPDLLTAANITDPASVSKANSILAVITAELDEIAAAIPAA